MFDLDLFYGNVKFGHLGFWYGKKAKLDFSDSFVACDIKVDLGNYLNKLS